MHFSVVWIYSGNYIANCAGKVTSMSCHSFATRVSQLKIWHF